MYKKPLLIAILFLSSSTNCGIRFYTLASFHSYTCRKNYTDSVPIGPICWRQSCGIRNEFFTFQKVCFCTSNFYIFYILFIVYFGVLEKQCLKTRHLSNKWINLKSNFYSRCINKHINVSLLPDVKSDCLFQIQLANNRSIPDSFLVPNTMIILPLK